MGKQPLRRENFHHIMDNCWESLQDWWIYKLYCLKPSFKILRFVTINNLSAWTWNVNYKIIIACHVNSSIGGVPTTQARSNVVCLDINVNMSTNPRVIIDSCTQYFKNNGLMLFEFINNNVVGWQVIMTSQEDIDESVFFHIFPLLKAQFVIELQMCF